MTVCIVYRRGDPDFDKIAAEIMPIGSVGKGLSHPGNTFTSEQDRHIAGRRNESYDEIRGTK
jgi:hypothetical protein